MRLGANIAFLSLFFAITAGWASSQSCNFVTSSTTMTLAADCVTAATITIPDGITLNGNGHSITAVNPSGGSFVGPVLSNAFGATHASVKNVILDAPDLGIGAVCPDTPVSGIVFDSVSGSITGTTVLHTFNAASDGSSVCLLSYGIYVTNATTGAPISVNVSGNKVLLSGVQAAFWAEGTGVIVSVSGNQFQPGGPAGFRNFVVVGLNGAGGSVSGNIVEAASGGGGYGIFLQGTAAGTKVTANNINLIGGQVWDGILIAADNAVINGNRVFNYGTSGSVVSTGIDNGGQNPASNKIIKNEVRCYATPFVNVSASGNLVLPCPWP